MLLPSRVSEDVNIVVNGLTLDIDKIWNLKVVNKFRGFQFLRTLTCFLTVPSKWGPRNVAEIEFSFLDGIYAVEKRLLASLKHYIYKYIQQFTTSYTTSICANLYKMC